MPELEKGSTDPNQLNEGGGTDSEDLKPREFFWDSVILYLVSVILALSAVDALTEFIRGTGVSCVTSDGTVEESVMEYINSYCAGSLPITEYIPAFIFVHGLAISIPHFLWLATYGGQFDYFFSVVKKLYHFRDETTGKYPKQNIDLVRQLEQSFTTFGRNSIYWLYIGKLGLQSVFALASLVLATYYFTDFDVYFHCPRNNNTDDEFWPLSTGVTCVFTSLKLLYWIRIADILLICLIVCSLLWGFWFCASGHPTELGSKEVARFSFQSGIQPQYYVSHCWYAPKRLSGFLVRFFTLPFTVPRVSTDLDFMLLKLYRTNAGFGKIIKDIQIELRIQNMTEQDHIAVSLFNRKYDGDIKVDIPEDDLQWEFKYPPKDIFGHSQQQISMLQVPYSVRGAIMGLSSLSKGTGAMSITFNTTGYGQALSRLFERTADVVFTDTKRGMEVKESEGIVEQLVDIVKNSSSHVTITIPENFLMSHEEHSGEFYQRIRPIWMNINDTGDAGDDGDGDGDDDDDNDVVKTSFLIVGPMNEDQSTIINLFLNELCSDPLQLEDGCIIVILRPIRIAGKGTSKEFPGLRRKERLSGKKKYQTRQIIPPNCTTLDIAITVSKGSLSGSLSWPLDLSPKDTSSTIKQSHSTKGTTTTVPAASIQSTKTNVTGLQEESEEQDTVVMMSSSSSDGVHLESSLNDKKMVNSPQINLLCGDIDASFEVSIFKFVYTDEWRARDNEEDITEETIDVEAILPKIENKDREISNI